MTFPLRQMATALHTTEQSVDIHLFIHMLFVIIHMLSGGEKERERVRLTKDDVCLAHCKIKRMNKRFFLLALLIFIHSDAT